MLNDLLLRGVMMLGKAMIPTAFLIFAIIFKFPTNKLEKVFTDCGLCKKETKYGNYGKRTTEIIPTKIEDKEKTDYGYKLKVLPPPGLSLKDFEDKQEALERMLEADLQFNNIEEGLIEIEAVTQKLPDICYYPDNLQTKHHTEFPLGMTKTGPITFTLNDSAPNLLIGGVPGSGKSVAERLIATYLGINKAAKGFIELILIDLKGGVEFGMFENSSFVKAYATNRNRENVTDIFHYLSDEMERRYEVLKSAGFTSLTEYNKSYHKKIPYIVVIIDEIANLDDKELLNVTLPHLLRMARASGMYFIMATQRPDANVLPGSTKANIPCTIAFKCRDSINSGILLGHPGAERLKGKGHGILQAQDEVEFQCYFLDDKKARKMIRPYKVIKEAKVEPLYDTSGVLPS